MDVLSNLFFRYNGHKYQTNQTKLLKVNHFQVYNLQERHLIFSEDYRKFSLMYSTSMYKCIFWLSAICCSCDTAEENEKDNYKTGFYIAAKRNIWLCRCSMIYLGLICVKVNEECVLDHFHEVLLRSWFIRIHYCDMSVT